MNRRCSKTPRRRRSSMSAAWHSSLCRGRGRSRSSSCGTPRRTRRTVRLCCALALVSAAFVGPSPDWNSGLPNAVGRCSTPSTSRRRRRSCGRGCRTHWLAHFPSRTRNNSLSLSLCRHIPRPSPCPGHRRCCRRCRLRHCSNRRARSRFISGRKPQVSRPTRFLRPASCPYVFSSFLSPLVSAFFTTNCFLPCCAILIPSLPSHHVSSLHSFALYQHHHRSTYVITLLPRKPWTAIINAVHVHGTLISIPLHPILQPTIPLISVVDQTAVCMLNLLTYQNMKFLTKRPVHGQ